MKALSLWAANGAMLALPAFAAAPAGAQIFPVLPPPSHGHGHMHGIHGGIFVIERETVVEREVVREKPAEQPAPAPPRRRASPMSSARAMPRSRADA